MSDNIVTEKLSEFLSVSPDVFWETDSAGVITFLSMQITGLIDHPPESFLGQPLAKLFSGLPCEKEWQKWVQDCLKGRLQPLRAIAITNNDKIVYIAAYAQRYARGLRGYLRDVTEAVENGQNAHDVEQQLVDTIDAVPYGVALFDREDRLVFINENHPELFSEIKHVMQPGVAFDMLIKAYFSSNIQHTDARNIPALIEKRLRLHRNGYGRREVRLKNDYWVEISEHVTNEGNTVVSWSDITTQKRRERALASLINDNTDFLSVSQRAAKAIAIALGCRWGAVVRLTDIRAGKVEMIALWDEDHFRPEFSYAYQDAPCNIVYQKGGYIHLNEDKNGAFDTSEIFDLKAMTTYHGLALRDARGALIGHIFGADDGAVQPEAYQQAREVFHLIAQWVEMEFRRQDMNQTIVKTQERFQDFAEVASDWFWEMDNQFQFSFVSEHAPEKVQEALVTMIRQANIEQPAEFALSNQLQNKIYARSAFRDVHLTTKNDDGTEMVFLVSGRPAFDRHGDLIGYRGTCTDITDVMTAHQRAMRAEAWLWEALESSPEAFSLYDKDDRLLVCNQKFKDIFFPKVSEQVKPGMSFDQILDLFFSQGITDLPPERITEWKANRILHRGQQNASPYNESYVGGRTYLAVEHQTKEGGVASFYVDITQLHEQEKILLKAKEDAESASRSKSEFLANISHELRTPLNAIIGFSELIRDELAGPVNGPKYKEYINDIHNSGMHLMELINDVLDLSKAESGKIEGISRDTDVVDVIESCAKLMRPKAERAYVKLLTHCAANLPTLWIDPKHLRQILLNLISNAVKFTPEGGTVDVSTGMDQDRFFITVKDTGIGMNPEEVPKAMAPFGQIDSSLARKYQGTGLGLPLTKRIIDHYGAVMDITTAPGKGTAVTFSFSPDKLRHDAQRRLSRAAE